MVYDSDGSIDIQPNNNINAEVWGPTVLSNLLDKVIIMLLKMEETISPENQI